MSEGVTQSEVGIQEQKYCGITKELYNHILSFDKFKLQSSVVTNEETLLMKKFKTVDGLDRKIKDILKQVRGEIINESNTYIIVPEDVTLKIAGSPEVIEQVVAPKIEYTIAKPYRVESPNLHPPMDKVDEISPFSYLVGNNEFKDEYKHISKEDLNKLLEFLQSNKDIFPLQYVPTIANEMMTMGRIETKVIVDSIMAIETTLGGPKWPSLKTGGMSGGEYKQIGKGGFGVAFTVDNARELIERYESRFVASTELKIRIYNKKEGSKPEIGNTMVLKELMKYDEPEKEIEKNNIVASCINKTYGGEAGKDILRRLDYHKISEGKDIPTHVIENYTPIHPGIERIEILTSSGRVYKTLVPSVKRDNDLKKIKNLSDDKVEKCYRSCLIILYALHQQEYYHFDIKPENIFYQSPDIYNLADYGIIDRTLEAGTPPYISPFGWQDFGLEQKRVHSLIKSPKFYSIINKIPAISWTLERHDLYALGLTLYDLQQNKVETPTDFVKRLIGLGSEHYIDVNEAINKLVPPLSNSLKLMLLPPTLKKDIKFKTILEGKGENIIFTSEGQDCLSKFKSTCVDFTSSHTIENDSAYEFFLNFFSLHSNIKELPSNEESLIKDFKNLISKAKDFSWKITNEVCIFIDLCQIYVKLMMQKKHIIAEPSDLKVLLSKDDINKLFKKVFNEGSYTDFPLVRFTSNKYTLSLEKFKAGIISFGDKIIKQLLNGDQQLGDSSNDDNWLRDMYIVSALKDTEDELTTTVFTSSFVYNIIEHYNTLLFRSDKGDLDEIKYEILKGFTDLKNPIAANQLIQAIYTRTYKLIVADYLRIYMFNAILYKCAITKCLPEYNVKQSAYMTKMKQMLTRIKETNTRFVEILNSGDDVVITFNFIGNFQDILQNPLVLKYSSLAEKILSFFQAKQNDTHLQDLMCKYIDDLNDLNELNLVTLSAAYTEVFNQLFADKIVKTIFNITKIPKCPKDFIPFLNALYIPKASLQALEKVEVGEIKDMEQGKLVSKFLKDERYYTQLVTFYENISGAVRVFVKIRDDYIVKLPTHTNNDNLEYNEGKWNFKEQGIETTNSFIKLKKNGKYGEHYGPFYSVIPPYHGGVRMNNKIVSEDYLHLNEMSHLLLKGQNQNLVLFTYGYSGSGKTYTLFGKIDEKGTSQSDTDKGAVFRFIEDILPKANSVKLESIKMLYGSLEVTDNTKITNIFDNAVTGENNGILKQINIGLSSKNVAIVNQNLMTLLYNITEKNNKQGVYDRIVKIITDYVREPNKTVAEKAFNENFGKIQTDFNVLKGNTAPGPSDWSTYIKEKTFYCKEAIYKELFPPTQDASKLYVKSTPNNPNSSRGFLFFTFNINGNKMVIVDMAGNEDPYDIMIKTIPTYKLPYGYDYYLLNNNDLSKNDMIVELVKGKITKMLEDIFQNMFHAIIEGIVTSSPDIFKQRLFGWEAKYKQNKYFNPDIKNIFAILNKNLKAGTGSDRYSFNYDMSKSKFMGNALMSNKNFEKIIKILNYNVYEFIIQLYKNLIKCAYNEYKSYKLKFDMEDNYVMLELQDEVVKYGTTLQPEEINKIYPMFNNVNKACDVILKAIKENLRITDSDKESLLFSTYNGEGTKTDYITINLNPHDIYLSVISVYYLCTDKIMEFQDIDFSGMDWIDDKKVFKKTNFDDLNKMPQINKDVLLNIIEKVSYTMDVLYFDKFKNGVAPGPVKTRVEQLSYIKYILQFIITSPLFTEGFEFDTSKVYTHGDKEKHTYNVLQKVKPYNNNSTKCFHINGSCVTIKSQINLNTVFEKQMVSIVKLEDNYETKPLHDKYSIIESSRNYFTTIIKEGFYINQVNYELVEFLKNRLKGDATGSYDYVKERELTILTALLSNSYNPNRHLLKQTQPPACTNILNSLNQLLNLTDPKKNNKFFMIANIRPDITKFRQGALNTLELVQELKST